MCTQLRVHRYAADISTCLSSQKHLLSQTNHTHIFLHTCTQKNASDTTAVRSPACARHLTTGWSAPGCSCWSVSAGTAAAWPQQPGHGTTAARDMAPVGRDPALPGLRTQPWPGQEPNPARAKNPALARAGTLETVTYNTHRI